MTNQKNTLPTANQVKSVQEYLMSCGMPMSAIQEAWESGDLTGIAARVEGYFGSFPGISITIRDAVQNIVGTRYEVQFRDKTEWEPVDEATMRRWLGNTYDDVDAVIKSMHEGQEASTAHARYIVAPPRLPESCAECGLYAPNHAKNCGSYGMEEAAPKKALAAEIQEAITETELLIDAEPSGHHTTRAKRYVRVGQLSKIRLALYHAKDMIGDDRVKQIALVASIERMQKMFRYIAKGEAVQAQAEQGIIATSEALLLVRE